MKKDNKKTLSLSTQTLRNLQADELVHASGALRAITVQWSTCFTCGRDTCSQTASMVISGCC